MALVEIASSPRAFAVPAQQAPRTRLTNAAFFLTFASAASIVFSIAVSQILMGAALAAALVSQRRLRFPPVMRPLYLFFALTVLSDLLSGEPRAGLPQIRKFYVYVIAVLVYTFFFGKLKRIAILVMTWAALAVLSATAGLQQFLARLAEAHRLQWNVYDYVLDQRMTGFAGHWMTFGGEQMIVLIMLASLLLFGERSRWRLSGWAAAALIGGTLVLGMTRSVYLGGVPAGLAWLLWKLRRAAVCLLPLAGIAIFATAPGHVRERIISVVRPHGDFDSNSRHVIMARAGWAMIRSHPWAGIGPEQTGRQFDRYVPADVPRPLPKGWYGHLHNVYLQYAAERGIPALLVFLWAIGISVRDFVRAAALRTGAGGQWILYGAIAVVAGVLVEGLFEHNLGDSEVLTMFLTVLALGYAAAGSDPCA